MALRPEPLLLVVVLALSGAPGAMAQGSDEASRPFACEGAVDRNVERAPALRLVAVQRTHSRTARVLARQTFTFAAGPFRAVTIVATTDASEEEDRYRGESARFDLWAVTVDRPAARGAAARRRRWRLIDERAPASYTDRFELRESKGQVQIVPAAPGPTQPLVYVEAYQDLGGANANNWSTHQLLLDFSQAQPQAAVAAVCGYNEGGGACTAQDSGAMARSEVACDWDARARDLLCTERRAGRRQRAFLRTVAWPDLLADEVATLDDALAALRTLPGRPVVVRGLGPVSVVQAFTTPSGRALQLVHTLTGVLVVPAAGGAPTWSRTTEIWRPPDASGAAPWTSEDAVQTRSRTLYARGLLTVIEMTILEQGDPTAIAWIGVEDGPDGLTVDVKAIASEAMTYLRCGMSRGHESVVEIGPIEEPFAARLALQPAFHEGDDGQLAWGPEEGEDAGPRCLQPVRLSWAPGTGFVADRVAIDCRDDVRPRYVRIDEAGRVVLVASEDVER
jgi:hypothetical protein